MENTTLEEKKINSETDQIGDDGSQPTPSAPDINEEDKSLLEKMIKAGVLLGCRKSKGHPKMAKYVFTTRNNVQLINLVKTIENFKKALTFLKGIVANGGKILFVGTTPSSKEITKEVALSLNMPYVCERWLGGTLTNFQTIKKRIDYFLDLSKKRETGDLEKYTKKERLLFSRELEKLENKFGGIKYLEKVPNALFIIDSLADNTAIKEARNLKIPVVALCNTNNDPDEINYLIPANNSAYSAVKFMLEYLKENLKV